LLISAFMLLPHMTESLRDYFRRFWSWDIDAWANESQSAKSSPKPDRRPF